MVAVACSRFMRTNQIVLNDGVLRFRRGGRFGRWIAALGMRHRRHHAHPNHHKRADHDPRLRDMNENRTIAQPGSRMMNPTTYSMNADMAANLSKALKKHKLPCPAFVP